MATHERGFLPNAGTLTADQVVIAPNVVVGIVLPGPRAPTP